jgi:hypothetical protein
MVTDDSRVRDLLELKDGENIFGPILLGYPKGEIQQPLKKEPKIKWL